MSVSLRFDGMAELRAALRNLPADLAAEGVEIIMARGEEATAEIIAEYPTWTGNLRKGVKLTRRPSPFGGVAIVKSSAPHAHLFEYGTQARHNSFGANRGFMPAGNIFAPIMMRVRRAMVDDLIGLLKRAGLEVRS